MGFFEPFALERFFAKHEFSARYLLCSSDCESFPIRELLAMEEGAIDRLLDQRLGYTETRGAPSLRAAIAEQYAGLGAESVFVHSGAEEAILNLYLAVLKPGDRVVVNYPCYQSLSEIPRALGCDVARWEMRRGPDGAGGSRWFLDPDDLPGLCGPGAGMIVMNAPHNPTGSLPTREEFEAIVSYARRTGAVLLVDEVYRRLERDQGSRLPSVCEAYENGVALDVLSKHSGLAGLRIGWLASRRDDILDAVAVVKDYNSICSSAPSETLAEIAVRNLERIAARNRGIVAKNVALLEGFFSRRPGFAEWTPPAAGSIAFPRLSDGSDAEALAERLVSESGVLLLPGAYYDYDRSYFRIGYGRANMHEALIRLEVWLDANGK
ncbi:MAG: aminotransferase class I/II-fold pyridoxal phosphate-dependent enzyme [Spirochaetes bacterium]|nr:aminotransferase class I/II-fold pyridoxal phosphate-dependent enzyme [Spirochaetota bacterium]MBU1080823.1 aminotransferase class I/II-fold pyridoxal phosphate-dependent enzyme [Spirochaetota bacterium]